MELANQFFATEIPQSTRYSLNLKQNSHNINIPKDKKEGNIRVRQMKNKMKKVNEELNTTRKDFLKARNSLDKTNQRTQRLRMQFMKMYGNKKLRNHQKSLMQDKKNEDQQLRLQIIKKVKAQKLSNELNLMYTKNENEINMSKMRQTFRTNEDILKNEVRLKRWERQQQAKQKYLMIKKGETDFIIRKKNMSAIQNTRARHNYLSKINRQLQLLENYNEIIEKVNSVSMSLTSRSQKFNDVPKQQFNKSFFVTTRNTFNFKE